MVIQTNVDTTLRIKEIGDKKLRKVLALMALALSVLVFSPQAHADEADFVRDITDAGFENSNGYKSEVAVGMGICAALLGGDTNYDQAHKLYLNSQLTSMADAEQFVRIAIKDLCP